MDREDLLMTVSARLKPNSGLRKFQPQRQPTIFDSERASPRSKQDTAIDDQTLRQSFTMTSNKPSRPKFEAREILRDCCSTFREHPNTQCD